MNSARQQERRKVLPMNGANAGVVHCMVDDGMAELVFDRPAARNAMTWSMYRDLSGHIATLAADRHIRAVLLRGAGGAAFVAGTDIAQFLEFGEGPEAGEAGLRYEDQIEAVLNELETLPMPTIALVDGWAVGGGLALASVCDFRLATPEARFGVPIAKTLGNLLSVANLARLEALWGLQRVRRMLLLAEFIGADEAVAAGVVHSIVNADELLAAGRGLAARLATLAPLSQVASKEGLRRVIERRAAAGDDLVRLIYGSADFREGVRAFTERRPPEWKAA